MKFVFNLKVPLHYPHASGRMPLLSTANEYTRAYREANFLEHDGEIECVRRICDDPQKSLKLFLLTLSHE